MNEAAVTAAAGHFAAAQRAYQRAQDRERDARDALRAASEATEAAKEKWRYARDRLIRAAGGDDRPPDIFTPYRERTSLSVLHPGQTLESTAA